LNVRIGVGKVTRIHPRRPGARRRGVAAVEFAVLLPLLCSLLFGIWQFGRLVQVKQIISNAAREGGRYAATNIATTAQVQAHIIQYLKQAGVNTTGMATPTVVNMTSTDPTRADPSTAQQMDRFQITVTVPTANFQWTTWMPLPTSFTSVTYWDCEADVPVASISDTLPSN
jgi:Flp pilus assembly protein TadG